MTQQETTRNQRRNFLNRRRPITLILFLTLLVVMAIELVGAAQRTGWGSDFGVLKQVWPLLNLPHAVNRFKKATDSENFARARTEYFVFDAVLGNRFRPNSLAYGLEPDETLQPRLAVQRRLRVDSSGFISHTSNGDAGVKQQGFPTDEQMLCVYISGGSTAAGWGASDNEHTWPALLETQLRERLRTESSSSWRDVIVVNGGVFGYGVSQELRRYLDEIAFIEPDIVVSFGGINERWGFNGFVVDYGLDGSQREMMNQFNRGTPFDPPTLLPYIRWFISDLKRQTPARAEADLYGFRSDSAPRAVTEQLLAMKVRQFHALCAQQGVRFLYVLQPAMGVGNKPLTAHEISLQQYMGSRYYPESWASYEKREREFYAVAQATLTENWHRDFTGVFNAIEETVYFDPRHYNNLGNQIVADRMYDEISSILGL